MLYNIVVVFVIHWHESAMDLHVFPIPIPPPASLPIPSLWVFLVHQPWALVSYIQPGLEICFTLDNIQVSMLFSWNIPPSPSPTVYLLKIKKNRCAIVILFTRVLQFFYEYLVWKERKFSCKSCPTLWDPMDCSLPGSSVHGIFPGKSTGVGCHSLLQRIFPTQGIKPGSPHCRQMLYRLSHQGSPGADCPK